jgi:soluble lytic murein transglycosylase-like protein
MPSSEVDNRVEAIQGSGSVQTDVMSAASAAGLTNEQTDIFRALISQESSNCVNRTGPATASGVAYGCGQLQVGTARELDPALAGLSDAEVIARLRDDNAYNLTLSARNLDRLIDRYGSVDLALAAYNGGAAANLPSQDCPGQRRWQCVWDSPGCYNTGATNCARNTGYEETRNYVTNIKAIATRL